jgi:hypothetical protein
MTHFCSFRLTNTRNTILAQGKEMTSDIIHDEGVRVGFPSSAPKARNALTFQGGERTCGNDQPPMRRRLARDKAFGLRQNTALPRANQLFPGPPDGSLLASKPGSFLASAEDSS